MVDEKGISVHLHSKKGKFFMYNLKDDRVYLKTNRRRLSANIIDVKCLATGISDLMQLRENMSMLNRLTYLHSKALADMVKRLKYEEYEVFSAFKEMTIGSNTLPSSEVVRILRKMGCL